MSNPGRYVREEPAEWAGLLERAQDTLVVPKPSYRVLFRLVRHAERLPGPVLEQNYTHGLGKIMCNMAKRLQDSEERKQLVGTTALSMVSAALQWRGPAIPMDAPFVPIVGDLLALVRKTRPARELTHKSWAELPPAEQLLADTLTTARVLRHGDAKQQRSALARTTARIASSITLQVDRAAVTVVSQNTFAGASAVLGVYLTGEPPYGDESEEQLNTPIDTGKIAALRHPKYFAPAALLRMDEFEAGCGWKDEGDSIAFDRSIFKTPPTKPQGGWPLSAERHGCPALFTDGLALDVALNILPQAITVSQNIVPGEHFQISSGRQ